MLKTSSDDALSSALRLPPPAHSGSDCCADYFFTLNIFGDHYPAFAYAMQGPSAERRMQWTQHVGESRASISIMYSCLRAVAAATENDEASPLHFIQKNGASEWLQNVKFVTVDEHELLHCNERFVYQLPVLRSRAAASASKSGVGSLIVCALKFGAPQSALSECVQLEPLLAQNTLMNEPNVFIVCPLAIVPSGARHFNLRSSAPLARGVRPPKMSPPGAAELADVLKSPKRKADQIESEPSEDDSSACFDGKYLEVPLYMQLNKKRHVDETEALFSYWYGQYLVKSQMGSYIDVWPRYGGPLSRFIGKSPVPSQWSRTPSMRDGEPLPYSLDAAHCLLAGMVRFHCERKALLDLDAKRVLRFGSEMDASGELIAECLYTRTVRHSQMSFRELMRADGFAALCKKVYRALLHGFAHGAPAPRFRRLARWFTDTLGCAVSMVLQCENTVLSEQETLRFLQYNGLLEYPDVPAEEKRYLHRDEIVSVSKLPPPIAAARRPLLAAERYGEAVRNRLGNDGKRAYLIRARLATQSRRDRQTLAYYRSVLPRADTAADIKWIFEMRMENYLRAASRGTREFGKLHNIIVHQGVVQLLWLHLVDVHAPHAPVDAPFNVAPARQPWIADFFVNAIVCERRSPRSAADTLLCSLLDDDNDCPQISACITARNLDAHQKNEAAVRMSKTIASSSLTDCLPVANGVFLPNRGRYLRDAPLSGRRHDDYVRLHGGKAVSELIMDTTMPDFVAMYNLEMSSDDAVFFRAGNEVDTEGDEGVVYNVHSKAYEKMNLSTCVSRAPPHRRIEDAGERAENDAIEALRERGALPPCMLALERKLADNEQDMKYGDRVDYALMHYGNTGIVDIEDIVEHVKSVERELPRRADKIEKHANHVRSLKSHYEKRKRSNVEYLVGKFGRARSAAGCMSCKQIESRKAALSIGSSARCPYAEYAAQRIDDAQLDDALRGALRGGDRLSNEQRHALRSAAVSPSVVCAQVAQGGDGPLRIKYPRDYTRVVLHIEYDAQQQVQQQ